MSRLLMILSFVFAYLLISGCEDTSRKAKRSEAEVALDKSILKIGKSVVPKPGVGSTDGCQGTAEKGIDKIYCIDTASISKESYCLRATFRDARHVRALQNADALVTFDTAAGKGGGHMEKIHEITSSDPCYKTLQPQEIKMAGGNRFEIRKIADNKLSLQIWDENGQEQFSPALSLSPGKLSGKFYWVGTYPELSIEKCRETQACVDYFVMLADKSKGFFSDDSNDNGAASRIEHFYFFEGYRSQSSNSACNVRRPDYEDLGHLMNFSSWPKYPSDSDCEPQSEPEEGTTMGGGHNEP